MQEGLGLVKLSVEAGRLYFGTAQPLSLQEWVGLVKLSAIICWEKMGGICQTQCKTKEVNFKHFIRNIIYLNYFVAFRKQLCTFTFLKHD